MSEDRVEGSFDGLLAAGREHGGTVLISHEGFGRATAKQVLEIGKRLSDFEVHVVLTVRDLGRTISASWQERIKNMGVRTFATYAEMLTEEIPETDGPFEDFWPTQNVEQMLERWSALCPPERIHVVICPQQGAPRDELWNRFGAALQVPRELIDLDAVATHNESLGVPQIELLRRVNIAIDGRVSPYWMSRIVKRWLAQELLSQVPSRKAVTPGDVLDRFERVSRRWIDAVAQGRHQVYGEIEDLHMRRPGPGTPHPDAVSPSQVLEQVPEVMAEMVVRLSELSESRREQRDQLAARAERMKALRARNATLQRELSAARSELSALEAQLQRRRRFWPFRAGARPRV